MITDFQGNPPSPRSDHAAASVGSKMYIFGGSDSNVSPQNDLFVFDTGKTSKNSLKKRKLGLNQLQEEIRLRLVQVILWFLLELDYIYLEELNGLR